VTVWLAIAAWALATGVAVQAARMTRKLELVARADHELRGPVSALRLAVAAFGRSSEQRRRAEALDVHLDRLELGLADLAAARQGRRARPRPTAVSLDRVTRAAVDAWEPAAREAGGELRVGWHAGPRVAHADRARLSQALGNVLANAVEHGGGRVDVSGERADDKVRITGRDEGRPAPPAAKRRPAPLADSGRRSDRGRGLAIAAGALDEMGASLEAPWPTAPRRVRKGAPDSEVRIELPVLEAPSP
jgi:signal transduction histidine kinase